MLRTLAPVMDHFRTLMFKIKDNKKELLVELAPNNSSSLLQNMVFFG